MCQTCLFFHTDAWSTLMVLSAACVCVQSIPLPWISVSSSAPPPQSYPLCKLQTLDAAGHLTASSPNPALCIAVLSAAAWPLNLLLPGWLSPTRTYPRYIPRGKPGLSSGTLLGWLGILCGFSLAVSLCWPQCSWHSVCVLFSFTGYLHAQKSIRTGLAPVPVC